MGQAIIMGGGSQARLIHDSIRDYELYAHFTNYADSNVSAPNPVGISAWSTHSVFNSLKGYFTIDTGLKRIIINKMFFGKCFCYVDSNVASSIVIKNSSDVVIFNSGDMASSARYNAPVVSPTIQFQAGDYIEFRNGDDTVPTAAACYKTILIRKEVSL